MRQLTLTGVAALPQYRLQLTWHDRSVEVVELRAFIWSLKGLRPLRQRALFVQAGVGEDGLSVTWPGDLDIGANTLRHLMLEQSGRAFPTGDFRAWMQRNGLSLTSAAQTLGLTRRTITSYSSGQRPVPRYIGLACRGWEAMQGAK